MTYLFDEYKNGILQSKKFHNNIPDNQIESLIKYSSYDDANRYWNNRQGRYDYCWICGITIKQCDNLWDFGVCCKHFFDYDPKHRDMKGVRCMECINREKIEKNLVPLTDFLVKIKT